MDPNEAPLSTSPSNFNFSQQRHFYLAVDRFQFKMLVAALVTSSTLSVPPFPLSHILQLPLCDLAEVERARVLSRFRQATMRWNKQATTEHGDAGETEKEEEKSNLIVVTDACLPLVNSGESPVNARVLINYELPTKKETYTRRMATCLAADGIVINMVVGGEVVTLKSIEENSGLLIAEMPINIFEML
uniref:Eukaryotic initiation factor 4A-I isoform X2 n=1 Tax=Nicotiana tabacum TaxID=4097 RepID=A0A1S4CJU6_TOBAC|nr:PREDICTED: eukaryotic initiation factor 4A-I-like isoform X2 [Nicotiana tabacum]